MLGKQKRSAFEHENALAASCAPVEKLLGDGRAKSSATDYDKIESPHVGARRQQIAIQISCVRAIRCVRVRKCFVEGIADVAPEHVEREVGGLRSGADIHGVGSPWG